MIPPDILSALIGGALIGVSAVGLLLVNGRIAGISGILDRATQPGCQYWQWAFLVGLVMAGVGASFLGAPVAAGFFELGHSRLIIAGFLVGLGTHIGSGCTSGHGVCGIANLSIRSLTATITFMLVAGITVYVEYHL